MKKKVNAIFSSIFLLIGYMIAQMLVPIIIGLHYGISSQLAGKEVDRKVAESLGQSQPAAIMMTIVGLLFLLLVFKLKKTKIKEYIKIKSINFEKSLIYFCYGIGFQIFAIIGNIIFMQFYNIEKSSKVLTEVIKSGNTFLSLFIVIIIAPIVEEFLFRGMIFTKLKNHLNTKIAIFIQALLFSLIHFNMAQMVPTFLLGLFLGFCYLKFENLLSVIVIHLSFNIFGSLAIYIPENMQFIILILPIIGGIMSVILTRKQLKIS